MKKIRLLFVLANLAQLPLISISQAESTIDTLYAEAERAYLNGNTQAATQSLDKLFSQSPDSSSARSFIKGRNLRGLISFQSKNLRQAAQEFDLAVQLGNRQLDSSDSILHLARYNLGNALFQQDRASDAYELLKSVNPSALDADTRMRFHHLLGNVMAAREESIEALLNYLLAANMSKDTASKDTFLQKSLTISRKIFLRSPEQDLERLVSLLGDLEGPAAMAAQALVARGNLYVGRSSKAKSLLEEVIEKTEIAHPFRARAEEMLADISKLTDVNSKKVGVSLPLSGKFGKFGRPCLNAINLSAGMFENMPQKSTASGLQIIIRDSGETMESAVNAFDELVKEEKAIAIVGPLLSKQFSPVARRAQEYGVPLFSLSQRIEVNQMGSYIFPIALSPAQQIAMIVEHAIEKSGYRRFAILAPNDSFGNEYANLFWDEVERRGGQITGIERYEPKSTDFREEIKKLLGLEYLESRSLELNELKRRESIYASSLKVKGKLRQRLLKAFEAKPVVDFDAVFVPDDPATVGQIAPAFAVREVEQVPMLGINTWNTPEIIQRAGRYLQNALFVDGFFASSKEKKTIGFVQEYMKHFGAIPGTIEAQAYDAMSILIEALANANFDSRAQLRDRLISVKEFSGISGNYQFTSSGVSREAHLLTVKGYAISEIAR